ncbi:MAG: CRISPR-associated endonuclease Cas3'', partial [Oceanipulchritudo sp.]
DLDFDALVTECASLDALRQRFGRLNRTGRDIPARATIVMPDHLIETDRKKLDKLLADEQALDPIYGNALSETWNWLQSVAREDTVDFGIKGMGGLVENLTEDELERLQAPTSAAPTLFPAYLDAWAQTNPMPWPDPDPALFLHGKQSARPDVLVVWRADLSANSPIDAAVQDLSLCPPSQVEALPVPLHVFRNWFFQADRKTAALADNGDLLDSAVSADTPAGRNDPKEPLGDALLWKGISESRWIKEADDLYPGATIVLPLTLGGWSQLGHIPGAPNDPASLGEKDGPPQLADLLFLDLAEEAFRVTRDRTLLRLRVDLLPNVTGGEAWQALMAYAGDVEASLRKPELRKLLEDASRDDLLPDRLRNSLAWLADRRLGFTEARYADERGIVLTTRQRLHQNEAISQAEDESDEWSRIITSGPVTLRTHTDHVRDAVIASARALGLSQDIQQCLAAAADLHDWGKLDPRFQALLLGGNPHATYALPEPLAKSDRLLSSAREREHARERSGLPKGFRHEFSSLLFAAHPDASHLMPESHDLRDLMLHLIAVHHGHARPFPPVIVDPDPPPVSTHNLPGAPDITLTTAQRRESPAHRLDSGIPDRFWRLLRQHGPWGLAFLETVLRLADQQASEAEAEGWYGSETAELETTATS